MRLKVGAQHVRARRRGRLAAVAAPARLAMGARSGARRSSVPNRSRASVHESLPTRRNQQRRPACGEPRRPADDLDGSGFLHGDYATALQRDRQPGLLDDQHLRVARAARTSRAGDGRVLLGSPSRRSTSRASALRTTCRAIDNLEPQKCPHQPARRGQLCSRSTTRSSRPLTARASVDDAEDVEAWVPARALGHAIHSRRSSASASEQVGAISEGLRRGRLAVSALTSVSERLGVPEREAAPARDGLGTRPRTQAPPPTACAGSTLNLHYPPICTRGARTTARPGRARSGHRRRSATARPRR